jgi:hypothetical protein
MPDPRQRGSNRRPSSNVGLPGAAVRTPKKASDLVIGQDLDLRNSHPCWNFAHMDTTYAGSWDWNLDVDEQASFFGLLKEMQRLTWAEIEKLTYNGSGGYRKPLHHAMPTEGLCDEAKDRLHAIRLGEQETLYRFRLGSTVRLWGAFLPGRHELSVIWWDRDHQVYPLD